MQESTFATHEIVAERSKRTIRPVSADETLREYGRAGRREAGFGINIWKNRNVRPSRITEGIVEGITIRTWRGDIEVTRVGTEAGFGMLRGQEVRWEMYEVREIIVPARNEEVAA